MFACCGGPAPGAKKEITSSTPSAAPATKSFSSGPNNPASEANKEQPAVVTPAAAAAAPTPPAAELPAGWEAVISQSTGDTYYKNTATGETTWDLPSATTSATLGLVPSVSAPEVGGRAPLLPLFVTPSSDTLWLGLGGGGLRDDRRACHRMPRPAQFQLLTSKRPSTLRRCAHPPQTKTSSLPPHPNLEKDSMLLFASSVDT